jgi:hypothetical protein
VPSQLADQVAAVYDIALEELAVIWALSSVDEITEALHELMPGFIDTWSTAAAALAADWYDDLRETKNVKGRFTAIIPDLGDKGAHELVGWATQSLRQEVPDFAATRTLLEGGAQRRIVNSSRDTVMTSSVADPQARGWRRRARGKTCDFCLLLVNRGGVYTQASAQFKTHDHCDCYAEPSWR